MMKKLLIIAFAASIACLYSCKKDSLTKNNKQLIVGRWAPLRERVRALTSDGLVVKDSTFDAVHDANYYYETYNSNGTAYVTLLSGDTSSRLGYAIDKSQLTIYQNGDKGDKSHPIYLTIMQVSATNLGLENKFSAYPAPGDGLDPNTVYNFISDVYYEKQN